MGRERVHAIFGRVLDEFLTTKDGGVRDRQRGASRPRGKCPGLLGKWLDFVEKSLAFLVKILYSKKGKGWSFRRYLLVNS